MQIVSAQEEAMADIDFFGKSEIESAIQRLEELLGCGIFQPQNSRNAKKGRFYLLTR